MLEIAVLLAAVALVAVPGVCLWRLLFPEESGLECWIWGAATAAALAVLLAFYCAYARLSLFWPAWSALAALCLLIWGWRAHRQPGGTKAARNRCDLWLALLLAVVAVSRFAPVFMRDFPPGWDPSFHLILARKLLLADHMVFDWSPFETVPLNYPLGSHLLVGVLARLTRLPLPRVFQLLIPALGVISTAQVYGLAQRVFRRPAISLYSALAYGGWAFAGSAGYYAWGGLPNQLGMMFLIALLAIFVEQRWDWRSSALAAVFLAAVFVSHHHVLLIAGAVTLSVIAYWLATAGLGANKKIRGLARAAAVAVALASPYLAPHIMRAATVRDTGVLRFTEPYSLWLMLAHMGILLVGCGIAGLILSRRDQPQRAGVLLTVVALLLVLYAACGPLYRTYSLHRWGQEYVAFTPSRFLTDLIPLLSIFAGYALYRVAELFRLRPGAMVAGGLLLALTNVPFWMELFARDPAPGRYQAYAWIEQHTPADTILLSNDEWAPYAAWRRTPATPLPVSEPAVIDNPARAALAALASGRGPGTTLVVGVVAPQGLTPGIPLWRARSGWSVVQLWPQPQVRTGVRSTQHPNSASKLKNPIQ